jgi:hypothetical protein
MRDNEKKAIQLYEETTATHVTQCGLFIDEKHGFLGASPDGLIGQYGCIRVEERPWGASR